ncbi:hypothetical protein Tco_1151422 [Tanacetum coccineum]
MRCSTDESRCYGYTLDGQRKSRDAVVVYEMFNRGFEMLSLYIRCSVDESSLSTLHFLKFPENIFEVLKLLENNMEVLKIMENKLELMKILENKLESLKLYENQLVDRLAEGPLKAASLLSGRGNADYISSTSNVLWKQPHRVEINEDPIFIKDPMDQS